MTKLTIARNESHGSSPYRAGVGVTARESALLDSERAWTAHPPALSAVTAARTGPPLQSCAGRTRPSAEHQERTRGERRGRVREANCAGTAATTWNRALNDLRRELIKSNNDRADAAKEIRLLQSRVAELQGELDEAGTPTYSGLGNTARVHPPRGRGAVDPAHSQADIDAQRLRASSRAEASAP